MSEAAEAITETSEPSPISEVTPEAAPEETPDFNLFEESEESSSDGEVTTSEPESEASEDKSKKAARDGGWSAKVRKDRQQRTKEIELKRRDQELTQREELVKSTAQSQMDIRNSLINNPEEFFRSQGIDPFKFYEHWTSRMATGEDHQSAELQNSSTAMELKELKETLARKELAEKSMKENSRREQVVGDFYKKIDDFKSSNEKFPLTSAKVSSQDIAEGMSTYWKQTGVQLSLEEAFKMIEDGLVKEEQQLFDDPNLVARFKQHHNIEDAPKGKQGRTASRTLSSKMAVAPTKQAPEDMTHEEIIAHWSGKIYT